MSKLYIPTLALALVGGGASAQHAGTATAQSGRALSKAYNGIDLVATRTPSQPTGPQFGERAAFYTEDFSGGGVPSGWTNEDLLTPVADVPVFFEWSDDPAAVTAAAAGQPSILTFDAPGASDGYLWANSDRGLTQSPGTEHLTVLTTTAIDCSTQPSVQFTMQSTIGVFNNDANQFVKLKVSNNGVDWTDFFPFPCLEAGAAIAPPCSRFSDNPQAVAVNITSVAAFQPTVYLQFEWQGDWEYYWAIDDIELSPLPPNEIQMNYAYTSQTLNVEGSNFAGVEYGRVPQSQVRETMNFGAEIFNYGGEAQTNVVVTATVTGPSAIGPVVTNVGDLASNTTFLVDEFPTLPDPMDVGLYTADFSINSDQLALDLDPTNNSKVRTFSVTTDTYSLDGIGLHPGETETLAQTGSGSFADNTENVKLLTYYEIYNPMTVTGVEIGIGPASGPGSAIFISILDTVDVLATPAVVNQPLVESGDPYIITQADVDAGVVGISFDAPFDLDPGAYYVVASCYAGTDDNGEVTDVFVLDDTTVPQPALASALWIPNDPPDNINFYGGNGTAWAVRLSTNPNILVKENAKLEGVTMYPNPTTGLLRIVTEKNEKFSVEVMNVLGEMVFNTKFTGMTTLDLDRFADGVYSVRVSNSTSATVQRITLN